MIFRATSTLMPFGTGLSGSPRQDLMQDTSNRQDFCQREGIAPR